MADVYDDLISVLNRLKSEARDEVLSIVFRRDDVPVDWDEENQRWAREEANG